ncbi:MAG: pyrroline-5-carboxylate reductase [Rhizobiales bacterium]|nr:pyrroline-5-carboxylate reductase [Hyphomicrobiales bacterium]
MKLEGKLVLLGAGKMGGAMLQGWLEGGLPASQIIILDPAPPPETMALISSHRISHNPDIAGIDRVAVVLAAVKPQIMNDVLVTVSDLKHHKPLILSIAAGKTIASFESHFGADAAVIRSIPNTPAAIGRGITAIAANANVSESQMALAENLLSSIGEVVVVDNEGLIDAATAVSGSGPAYVFYLAECLAAAGEEVGLPADVAVKLARATVAGAGELMRQSGIEAATLRENVTSPKGTTYAALQVLMAEDGLRPLIERAVAAAEIRSRELAG